MHVHRNAHLYTMRRLIAFRTAGRILLGLFVLVLLFQLVVLSGHVPTDMVWGGRLQNDSERTIMALVAIAVVLLFIGILFIRLGTFGPSLQVVSRVGTWAIVAVFALNTLGNLVAADIHETLIFTPLTLIAALLALRVALGEGER